MDYIVILKLIRLQNISSLSFYLWMQSVGLGLVGRFSIQHLYFWWSTTGALPLTHCCDASETANFYHEKLTVSCLKALHAKKT
jgi:hypothetical protein